MACLGHLFRSCLLSLNGFSCCHWTVYNQACTQRHTSLHDAKGELALQDCTTLILLRGQALVSASVRDVSLLNPVCLLTTSDGKCMHATMDDMLYNGSTLHLETRPNQLYAGCLLSSVKWLGLNAATANVHCIGIVCRC